MQLFEGTKVFSTEVGGRTLAIETGLLAPQAGGAVTVRYGDTVLLATATMSKDVRQGMNFFPLTVEFEERLYAAGRIPGSFFRREGKPSEQAILVSRLVDRPLRPLFPKGMRNETQVIVTALATDGQNLMDPLAIIAASAALAISDIPWGGPIAATTIGFVDGEFIVNPTADQMEHSGLNLVAAGTNDNILMVEAGANELPEDLMLDALKLAHESNQPVIALIEAMRAEYGKPKTEVTYFLPPAEVTAEVSSLALQRIVELLGGRIGADSELGKGSTFWFELPFEPSVQTEEPGTSRLRENDDARSRLAGLRVLIVDDSRLNLLVLQRALQSWGVDVMQANDGQQALQALRARPDGFHMVLMDVQMPVMDGLTATREIRKDPWLAALPVIALTAGVLPEERQAALEAGFNDVLNKPLDLQQVQARLLQYR